MNTGVVIECRDVAKRYGAVVALDGLSIEVRTGEVFALLGENGAGKTTLLRLILGLHWPDHGSIEVFGSRLADRREELLSRIGSTIEAPSFYPNLTGHENVDLVRLLRGLSRSETGRVLDIVGLSDAARRKTSGYSQGMKQRLALATALLGDPELVILDEPTNGLDPAGIREIREIIGALAHGTGATVLLSSHMLAEVEQVADRLAVIQRGKLLFQGSPAELDLREPSQAWISTPDVERAHHLLSASGFRVEPESDRLLVYCAVDDLHRVNRILVEAEVPVQELVRRRRTLEQLYFSLTCRVDS